MRCATSEERFEGLLEGTLAPAQRVEVEAHVQTCPHCASVLEELRVVDALLLTPRKLEPPPNFTFKAMAEIRTLPSPARSRSRWPWLFVVYLLLSWMGIGAWLAIGRPEASALAAAGVAAFSHAGGAFNGIARVAATGFGLTYAGVAGFVTLLLLLDLGLLLGVLFLRGVVRPRLAAHLARSEAG